MSDEPRQDPPAPETGHPGIDSALAQVAATDDPDALSQALDVLQSVLEQDHNPA